MTNLRYQTSWSSYNLQTGQLSSWSIEPTINPFSKPVLAPDGKTFAFLNEVCTGNLNGGQTCSNNLELRESGSGKLLYTLQQNDSDPVNLDPVIAFSPDGKQIAMGDADNQVKVRDTTNGKLLYVFQHDDSVTSLAFSPDGKRLASAGKDATVRFWDLGTGKNLFILRGFTQEIQEVAYLENGKKLLVGQVNDNTFQEYSLDDSGLPTTGPFSIDIHAGLGLPDRFNHFQPDPLQASVSPDTRKMAVILNQTVQIWDLETGKSTVNLPEYNSQITLWHLARAAIYWLWQITTLAFGRLALAN